MLMIEKLEDCPNGCDPRTWVYDSQRCLRCGYDALQPHNCDAETQEFRLQNDREWQAKLDHLKAEKRGLERDNRILKRQIEWLEKLADNPDELSAAAAQLAEYKTENTKLRERIADLDEQVSVLIKTVMKFGEQARRGRR